MSSVTTSGATRSAFSFARIWDQFGMLVVFAVLFIGCVIFVPNFASFVNMKGLGLAISMSGMVACGMLFCLASGDFDLSVASVIACAGVTTAVVIKPERKPVAGDCRRPAAGRGQWSGQRLCHCAPED
ncbi:L-arabinose transporter permease protein [Klebsiella aerogenes]|nr:L-arabinose transporter permease protein [Klebsiella aerogenes]